MVLNVGRAIPSGRFTRVRVCLGSGCANLQNSSQTNSAPEWWLQGNWCAGAYSCIYGTEVLSVLRPSSRRYAMDFSMVPPILI